MAGNCDDLTGKVALVTGASSGLGHRAAVALASAGAKVAVTARRVDRLEALAAEIRASGGQAAPFALDVRDPDSVAQVAGDAAGALGTIDILVNNAGVAVSKRPEDFTLEDYDFIHETNVKGPFLLAQAIGREMIKRGTGGKIINISSMMAMRVTGKLTLYGMSKAAIGHMTKQLALEWARHDIQVNAICPGYIETEMNVDHWKTPAGQGMIAAMPRRRIGKPDVMDGLLLLLASSRSDYMTGTLIPVDDGQVMM
ncbi:MAG: SDR family oxidoreductase [Rhodospirillaceae bacterium]|jgi:NAD(P)-dependent dehydrogenase (short-subunit alcohol dehydrogenase family)|nr:SDR family oxidoreductase [Rhodospirillaceae bacterium]MBT4490678.1 SDR family oxidoreductase [Rhodospirillaceae bacterium]MBT5894910.1 SDR family oxidoreductase [Rhodospirillaceae bacterium]MBT6428395.1 SDR family oxidoreductase [Rhodospirillaceae bacterium]MBT6913120.1 SDR family oxidoreductase [Rhodospirillaceae bacterium]